MAEVNVDKKPEERERNLERRSQGSGLARRGEGRFPSLWRGSEDLFSLSPFTLMRRLTEDMDRMFSGWGGQNVEPAGWIPPVEVREANGNLLVSAELPGMGKDDVKVEVNNDSLVIKGERKREWDEEREGVHRSERYYGSFYREILLPEGAKVEQAKAEFNNGVLEVKVPIPESQRRNRQIPIEIGGSERKPIDSQTSGQKTQQSKAG